MSAPHVCKCVICSPPGPNICQFESQLHVAQEMWTSEKRIADENYRYRKEIQKAADELAKAVKVHLKFVLSTRPNITLDGMGEALAAYEKARGMK